MFIVTILIDSLHFSLTLVFENCSLSNSRQIIAVLPNIIRFPGTIQVNGVRTFMLNKLSVFVCDICYYTVWYLLLHRVTISCRPSFCSNRLFILQNCDIKLNSGKHDARQKWGLNLWAIFSLLKDIQYQNIPCRLPLLTKSSSRKFKCNMRNLKLVMSVQKFHMIYAHF